MEIGGNELRQLDSLLNARLESFKRNTDCFISDLKKR